MTEKKAAPKNLPAKKEPAPVAKDEMRIDINLQELIASAIKNKTDLSVMSQLLDMRARLKKEQAEQAFRSAMSAFQAECPIIEKTKAVMNKGGSSVRYKYAPLDVIVKAVQPLLQKNSLSYDIDTIQEENAIKVELTVSHELGYGKKTNFAVPIDKDAFMSEPQRWAAAQTFAKRYAFCNGFGILTGDEDVDSPPEPEIEVDFAELTKKAANLIESSQSVKQLTRRGNELLDMSKVLPSDVRKQLSTDYNRRMSELSKKEINE